MALYFAFCCYDKHEDQKQPRGSKEFISAYTSGPQTIIVGGQGQEPGGRDYEGPTAFWFTVLYAELPFFYGLGPPG